MPTRMEKEFPDQKFRASIFEYLLSSIFQFCFMSKGMILNIFGMKIGGVRVAKKTPLSLNKWVHG